MESGSITTTGPAPVHDDMELPAYASSFVAPLREPSVLIAACGGAVGTMIAFALVACLLVPFGGGALDAPGSQATARAEPGAAIAGDPREKRETTDRDVLTVRPASAHKRPSPRVVRAAPRLHPAHRAPRAPHTSVMDVADALARAELEATLP